jgi:hypothetical protein
MIAESLSQRKGEFFKIRKTEREVAAVLGATIYVEIEKGKHHTPPVIAEARSVYQTKGGVT